MHRELHNLDLIGYAIIVPCSMQGPKKLLPYWKEYYMRFCNKNLRAFAFTYSH